MSDTSLGDSKTLVGQEEPGMFHYAQLIQERELVPVPIFAHDLAVPDLGEEDARHRRPSPGRWDGSPRDGGQPLGLGAAHRPVCEDLIALGEDAVDVKAKIGEGPLTELPRSKTCSRRFAKKVWKNTQFE
jgi:hypothetical protein